MKFVSFLHCCFYDFMLAGLCSLLYSFVMDVEISNFYFWLFYFCSDFCRAEISDAIDPSKNKIILFALAGSILTEFVSL